MKNFFEIFTSNISILKTYNPQLHENAPAPPYRERGRLQKVMVANRGEIAKRFFLSLHEEKIPSVAIVSNSDRGQSWYEFADEVVYIGEDSCYASEYCILAAAYLSKANAIYPGYGFLSESFSFVNAINYYNSQNYPPIIFMGPSAETMKLVSDKGSARELARASHVPLFPSSDIIDLSGDFDTTLYDIADGIGYPIILKPLSGGGGKGMVRIDHGDLLRDMCSSSSRTCEKLYGNSLVFFEKFIEDPIHIEVQIFNDHIIGSRKCAIQRRNQKIIEESGHTFLQDNQIDILFNSSRHLAQVSGYNNNGGAGTVEFLIDNKTGNIGFLEINSRLQVEYAVTDQSQGIDIARWQILLYDNNLDIEKCYNNRDTILNHSIECRIYAEDPENDYMPSTGAIREMDLPTFNGVRCDFGFTKGDRILSMFDPMIGKLIVHGPNRDDTIIRLERALQELYIKGIKTNVNELLEIVRHPLFRDNSYTNSLLGEIRKSTASANNGHSTDNFKHIIFAGLSEMLKEINKTVNNYFLAANLEKNTLLDDNFKLYYSYYVKEKDTPYTVVFIQPKIYETYVFIDDVYFGIISLESYNETFDDIFINYNSQQYRIRVDHLDTEVVLKFKNDQNKISYFTLQVRPLSFKKRYDTVDIIAPFQGTLVKRYNQSLKIGDTIEKGTPLFVISAMKMETTIYASESGKVEYIFKNHNVEDGEISISQGLVLIRLSLSLEDEVVKKQIPILPSSINNHNPYDLIYNKNSKAFFMNSIQENILSLFDYIKSYITGMIPVEYAESKILFFLDEINSSSISHYLNSIAEENIQKILQQYILIRLLYDKGLNEKSEPLYEEMFSYLMHFSDSEFHVSNDFEDMLAHFYEIYHLNQWEKTREPSMRFRQYLFFLLNVSYNHCIKSKEIIYRIVLILNHFAQLEYETLELLDELFDLENTELDDNISRAIDELFKKHKYHEIKIHTFLKNDFSSQDEDSFTNLSKRYAARYFEKSFSYINSVPLSPVPDGIEPGFREKLQDKLEVLKTKSPLTRLYSPDDNIVFYEISGKDGSTELYFFLNYRFNDTTSFHHYIIMISAILNLYQQEKICHNKTIEIIYTRDSSIPDNEGFIDYSFLSDSFNDIEWSHLSEFFSKILIDTKIGKLSDPRYLIRVYFFNLKYKYNILWSDDINNPYCTDRCSIKDQTLYNNNKWPIEKWVESVYDRGSVKEIFIDHLEGKKRDPRYITASENPIGSKIFFGTIKGIKICSYFKDSRISGGATGDREGLKYLASAYLSYKYSMPLFVWNDSAGANILEGVVSLNRGAEGFMMNALLAGNTIESSIDRYLQHVPDESFSNLITEIDKQFSFPENGMPLPDLKIVAMGIGSSAGLDVYGASQASVQVLVDSEEAYRVLTGSKVIKRVTGEEISNYGIGGAKVLGEWTGTVDVLANDNIHCIKVVHDLIELFMKKPGTPELKYHEYSEPVLPDSTSVLSDTSLHYFFDNDYFWPFKNFYQGTSDLTAGFGKLGGMKVLLLGLKSHFGMRSQPSIIKAKELVQLANRTSTDKIIVFGKKFIAHHSFRKYNNMLPHLDFIKKLKHPTGKTLVILTDSEGFNETDIISSSDSIIFVNPHHQTNSVAEKNSMFIVESFNEAFSISHRLLTYINYPQIHSYDTPSQKPQLWDGKSEYSIISSVIKGIADENTFFEVFRNLNDPHEGPFLVTGLLRIHGTAMGVIADEPHLRGGGADAVGTEKFRKFTVFLDSMKIPLLMLSSSSGFIPGSNEERYRIQSIGAESLNANILGNIPVVSIVLHRNTGGRLIHAFNRFLRPGIVYCAVKGSEMAVIGVDAAFSLLLEEKYNRLIANGDARQAEEMKRTFLDNYHNKILAQNDADKTGVLDWIIEDPEELREITFKALLLAQERSREAFE